MYSPIEYVRERAYSGRGGVERVGFVAERVYGVELRPETLDVLQREGNTVHQMAGVHEQSCEADSTYTGPVAIISTTRNSTEPA